MKKILLLLMLSGSLLSAAQKNSFSSQYNMARKMLQEKDYFRAKELIRTNDGKWNDFEKLVLNANLDNIFNKASASNVKIKKLFSEYQSQMPDSLKGGLLRLKHANHGRLFEYADAYTTATEIISKYKSEVSVSEIADFQNMAEIWKLLSNQPKQEIVNKGASIKMSRDKAQLANLPVKSGAIRSEFIFDTGANFSTVTETTAKQLRMKLLGGKIEVGSITGNKVDAQMAICPVLEIGSIRVRNAVFLVFPDTALAFPQIDYQINGIIGFPVIEAMGEVQITQDDHFIVPTTFTTESGNDMAFDFLTPVININGDAYTFDTGAVGTSLYMKFFEKHKEAITATYNETELEFGGAGGMVKKKGYVITYSPEISGKKLTVNGVQLLTEKPSEGDKPFYGNIGQDVIKQFGKMTINFRKTFIRFD
jgi:predicted aspartyl protease